MRYLLLAFLLLSSFNIFAADEILTAQTASGNTEIFPVYLDKDVTIIIHAASGHTAGEYADVQISHDSGTTWQDLFVDGVQVRLHSTNIAQTVYGLGLFRVQKDLTTNAVGVSISKDGDL